MLEIAMLVIGVAFVIFTGLFVLFRNHRDRTNILFSLLTLAIAAYTVANFFSLKTDDRLFLIRAVIFLAVISVSLLYYLILHIDDSKRKNSLINKAGVYLTVVIALLTLTPYVFSGLTSGKNPSPTPEPGAILFLLHLAVFLTAIYYTLINKIINSKGIKRTQYIHVLIGAAPLLLMPVTGFVLPVLFHNVDYVTLNPLYGGFFIGMVGYAIVKHRLFDVRMVVARSLGYVLSIFSVSIIFGLGGFGVISAFLGDEFDITISQQLLYTSLAVLIGFTFQPVKRFFDKATNSIFYQDAYDPQEFIDEHNKIVVSNTSVEPLLHDSSEVIIKYLKTEFCDFGLRETAYLPQRILGSAQLDIDDKDIEAVRKVTPHMGRQVIIADELTEEYSEVKERMQKYDIAILVRLATTTQYEIEGLGYMMLGAKKSGNPFNRQDIKVIEIIANELVIAIQNALRFEEIEKFNITLQEKVDDATRKLRHTNEKLKAMDETKDEFISMASHQLRTPLTSVKGYLSMVLEGDAGQVTEMQSKLLNQAFISSQRMVYLIADLLNVSRLRTGKFVIETKPTNLAEAVEGEVEQLKEVAASRDLTLTYEKPENFPVLELDETKIRQVVMNFTDNAIYYTPSGGHIKVELKDTGKTVEFTVTDNGIGVPKHEQPHLFSKFYRAVNAKKARPDGTGLGLFMAKKVVVAQGGAIIFKSQEGKGSTFGFSFAKSKIDTGDISA